MRGTKTFGVCRDCIWWDVEAKSYGTFNFVNGCGDQHVCLLTPSSQYCAVAYGVYHDRGCWAHAYTLVTAGDFGCVNWGNRETWDEDCERTFRERCQRAAT